MAETVTGRQRTLPRPRTPGPEVAVLDHFYVDVTWTGPIEPDGTGPGSPAMTARGSGALTWDSPNRPRRSGGTRSVSAAARGA